ncbi:RHS repeat domain-containing protein [Flavobacterium gelatinilyticum]|uniref:RHS repeat domain-containing protein n=1 Tax=Flavobacterium gelatinilyticum TaxID=3003260 RepID=UPI0024816B00|nr:RHS repeat-associated core domain-containing protein [Flavobacterium gelatinilyticum]
MKTDANKGITAISYNHLNLPVSVTINGGIINYFYDATGVKQRKTVSTGGSTDYAGSFVYENNALKQFSQPEGYIIKTSGIYNYIYQYKDHLGNIRLSYQDKDNNGSVNSSEIVQENNYYAFGLSHKGYNTAVNGIDNKYKYNGKELQDDNVNGKRLDLYDYGARNYDPALGRWMNIDPLAEKYRRWSSYNYCIDNPMRFIDPDGMRIRYAREEGQTRAEFREARRAVRQELRKISKESPTFKQYLKELQGNVKNVVEVSMSKTRQNSFAANNQGDGATQGKGTGGKLTVNLSKEPKLKNDTMLDGTKETFQGRSLIEEVIHASRAVMGEGALGDSKTNAGEGFKSGAGTHGIGNEEIETNTVVNQITVELGKDSKQRTTYTLGFKKEDEEGALISKTIALPIPIIKEE